MSVEVRPHPTIANIDEDLFAETCMGLGVQYPHLWEVVRRYILRGDSWFRNGGLAVLAATAENLPLNEAAAVLEQLWDKEHDQPSNAATGLLDPIAVKAVHAVATTAKFMLGTDENEIPDRMIRLLERTLERAERHHVSAGTKLGPILTSQEEFLRNTIEAIRDQKPFQGEFPPRGDVDHPTERPVTANENVTVTEKAAIEKSEVERIDIEKRIAEGFRHVREEVLRDLPSQNDLIVAKHGYELLDQRLTQREKLEDERFSNLDKSIDRHLTEKQLKTGERQVSISKWAIFWGFVFVLLSAVSGAAAVIVLQRMFPTT